MEIIEKIEELAYKSWPATEVFPIGDWKVRLTGGISKRSNSVYAVGKLPQIADWLKRIENIYEEASQAPLYYISESSPVQLRQSLITAGYTEVTSLFLMLIASDKIVQQVSHNNGLTIIYESEVTEKWVDEFIRLEQYNPKDKRYYWKTFSDITCERVFVTIMQDEQIVSVGSAVVHDDLSYLFNLVVDESVRRQGIAMQLIRSLAVWSQAHGAHQLCLQVISDNYPGLRLYEKLGFSNLSESSYYVKEL